MGMNFLYNDSTVFHFCKNIVLPFDNEKVDQWEDERRNYWLKERNLVAAKNLLQVVSL